MRNIFTILTAFTISATSFAQVDYENIPINDTPKWTVTSGYGGVKNAMASEGNESYNGFFKVTSSGALLVSGNQNITGYNANDGSVTFDSRTRKEGLPSLKLKTYKDIPNSPLFEVKSEDDIFFVNTIDGKIIGNSDNTEIKHIYSHYVFPKSASILYVGRSGIKSGLALQNLNNGDSWVQEKIFMWKASEQTISGKPFELSENEFLIPIENGLYCMNTKTGELKWRKYISTIGSSTTFDEEPKPKRKDAEGNLESSMLFKHADKNYIYLINPIGLMAYDLETGDEVWKRHRKADIDSKVIFTKDGLIVGTDKIYMYDYDTGEILYDKPAKLGGLISHYDFKGDDILLCVTKLNIKKQEYCEINSLNIKTGQLKFDKGFKVSGLMQEITSCDKGSFYTTDRALGIWDDKTGLDAFPPIEVSTKKKIGDADFFKAGYVQPANGSLLTVFKDNMGYVFNSETNSLYAVDTKAGTKKQLGSGPVMFEEEGRDPDFIEVREKGVYLSADKTMTLIGFDGKEVYKRFFADPPLSRYEKIMLLAANIYENYRMQNDPVRPTPKPLLGYDDFKNTDASIYEKTKAIISNNARVTVNLPNTNEIQKIRFELSGKKSDFNYMVTSIYKGSDSENNQVGLAKVNKDTGEVIKVFPFGENKKPEFTIDQVSQKMFYLNDGKISCYDL